MCAKVVKSTADEKAVFFTVRITRELHVKLQQLAKANERTLAGEVRAALRSHTETA